VALPMNRRGGGGRAFFYSLFLHAPSGDLHKDDCGWIYRVSGASVIPIHALALAR